jgi:hypothetical protein
MRTNLLDALSGGRLESDIDIEKTGLFVAPVAVPGVESAFPQGVR